MNIYVNQNSIIKLEGCFKTFLFNFLGTFFRQFERGALTTSSGNTDELNQKENTNELSHGENTDELSQGENTDELSQEDNEITVDGNDQACAEYDK